MAETLKDLVAKLKAQQNANSPQAKKVEPPTPENDIDLEAQTDELLENDFENEPAPTPQPKKEEPKVERKVESSMDIKQLQEAISSLHDNGVYRLELLDNLKEMNKSLRVIAGVLLELSGYGKSK